MLFAQLGGVSDWYNRSYDVNDGEFLLAVNSDGIGVVALRLVINWLEEVKARFETQ